jgi:hypothetical protein
MNKTKQNKKNSPMACLSDENRAEHSNRRIVEELKMLLAE